MTKDQLDLLEQEIKEKKERLDNAKQLLCLIDTLECRLAWLNRGVSDVKEINLCRGSNVMCMFDVSLAAGEKIKQILELDCKERLAKAKLELESL